MRVCFLEGKKKLKIIKLTSFLKLCASSWPCEFSCVCAISFFLVLQIMLAVFAFVFHKCKAIQFYRFFFYTQVALPANCDSQVFDLIGEKPINCSSAKTSFCEIEDYICTCLLSRMVIVLVKYSVSFFIQT